MGSQGVQAVRAVTRLARVLECALDEVSPAQYRVLAAVAAGGERATHLAHGLALAKPTVTAAVDGLVERGFLAREPVAGDRRSLRIALTPAGRLALDAADEALAARLASVLASVTDPDATLDALAELAAALDSLAARPPALDTARGRPL